MLTKKEQSDLEQQFANWMYMTAIPFWIVDQQSTIDFFAKLRPSFKLPDRRALSDNLLLAAFLSVQIAVTKLLGKSYVALTSDGWARTQGSVHVINFNTVQPGRCVFVDMATCHTEKLGGSVIAMTFCACKAVC